MTPAERFGLLLCHRRLLSGLSQEALAALVGIHRTEISIFERGGREPRLDTLLLLAAGVEVEPGELVSEMRWVPGIYDVAGGYNRETGRGD